MRIVLFALSFFLVSTPFADGLILDGHVVGVTDGDTITVLDAGNQQHEIRLAAIDSPETSCHARHPGAFDDMCVEQGQPFGKAAKKSLAALTFDKDVRVLLQPAKPGSTVPDGSYGREIGTIMVNSVDANLMQVARGYAWHYKQYASKWQTREDYARYENAEQLARRNRVGLWGDQSPIPPWDYRHSHPHPIRNSSR